MMWGAPGSKKGFRNWVEGFSTFANEDLPLPRNGEGAVAVCPCAWVCGVCLCSVVCAV